MRVIRGFLLFPCPQPADTHNPRDIIIMHHPDVKRSTIDLCDQTTSPGSIDCSDYTL